MTSSQTRKTFVAVESGRHLQVRWAGLGKFIPTTSASEANSISHARCTLPNIRAKWLSVQDVPL